MIVTGPLAVAPLQRTDDSTLVLRLNQRVNADIMQVSADTVTMVLQGINVVARLSSPDQAALLAERRVAQFVIRDISQNSIQLQLVAPGEILSGPIVLPAQSLVASLLQQAGLPVDGPRIQILNAMLSQGMTVDPEALTKLLNVLNQSGPWGIQEAQIAVAMAKANLPLTPASLALALHASGDLGQALGQLLAQLESSGADPQTPPELAEAVRQALAGLQKSVADWSAPPASLADNLKQAINLLGHSLEQELANQVHQGAVELEIGQSTGFLALALIRRELAKNGLNPDLEERIDRFLESLRFQNLSNTEETAASARDPWATLEVPLQVQNPSTHLPALPGEVAAKNLEDIHNSRMRIAYQKDSPDKKIDPGYTRLVIQVDVDASEILEVDLSIVKHQVSARVTTPNPVLCQLSEEEIPNLKQGLASSGFDLQTSRCDVGEPKTGANLGEDHSSTIALRMQSLDIGA